MASDDKPSNQPPDERLQTLSETASRKAMASAKEELAQTVSANAGDEVAEATNRFVDGVDVLTEGLLLILSKFQLLSLRVSLAMTFNIVALGLCAFLAYQTTHTAKAQRMTEDRLAGLTLQLQATLTKLDQIQSATEKTEKKVDEVKQTTEEKSSIELVPSKKGNNAKLVIRPSENKKPPPSASGVSAPPPPEFVEIPIQFGK